MPNLEDLQKHLKQNEALKGNEFHLTEAFQYTPVINKEVVKENLITEGEKESKKIIKVLKPRIESIHAGKTRNGNVYISEKLKGDYKLRSGVFSFTYPYPKPMLKNHDRYSEPTGRITNAQFISDSSTGKEAILIVPEITDQDTIQKILDGRYLTVSIGATTDSVTCNICGQDILKDGWCGHARGETYDEVECAWILGNLWFDECSWVTVPSDSQAKIIDKGEQIMEAYAQVGNKYYDLGATAENAEVKKTNVEMLGLKTPKPLNITRGGSSQVDKNQTEEFNALKQAKEDVDKLLIEKEALIEKLNNEIKAKNQQLTEKDNSLAEKKADLEKANSEVISLTEEKDNLLNQLTELKAEALKNLVERVVDLKIALGTTIVDKQKTIEYYLTRSQESLEDTLKDLSEEFATRENYRGIVTNPAGGSIDEEKSEDKEKLTEQDVMVNLFKGNLGRMK